MTFIDPGAFFNNFQRLNDEETMPELPKVSPVAHYSNALFGSHPVASTEESVPSRAVCAVDFSVLIFSLVKQ